MKIDMKELRPKPKASKPAAKKNADKVKPNRPWSDPDNRPPDFLRHLKTKVPYLTPHLTLFWKLTDEEIEQVIVDSQRALVDAWGVETGPYPYERTLRDLGGSVLRQGWSIVPQDRTGERKPSKIPGDTKKSAGSSIPHSGASGGCHCAAL